MRYRIEKDDQGTGLWFVVTTADDGVVDIVSEHGSRAEAEAARDEGNRDTSGDERHHAAQYAHACGYHD